MWNDVVVVSRSFIFQPEHEQANACYYEYDRFKNDNKSGNDC
jgi:hypothetical protein